MKQCWGCNGSGKREDDGSVCEICGGKGEIKEDR